MKNKILLIAVSIVLSGAGFVGADYVGLFGITEKPEYVLQEVRIRPYNMFDNAPIEGVRVRCFQQGNGNACTQRDSGRLGIVSVMVPSIKLSRRSLLFEKGYHYIGSRDPKIQIMLIHVDYISKVESVEVAGLLNLPGKLYKVNMEPRISTPDNQ